MEPHVNIAENFLKHGVISNFLTTYREEGTIWQSAQGGGR
jgi:hypothetical protein